MKLSNIARSFILAGTVALVAGGAWIAASRAGWMSKDEAEVQSRYLRPNSQFIEIDGVNIHYVIEGKGPPVLLLHGSYLDLGVWDGWAKELARDYQVVRVDRAAFGLTGRDLAGKPGYQRESSLIAQFADRLGLQDMVLVAASSGGTSAARIAAIRPDLVSRLILINFPLSRGVVKPKPLYATSIWIRDKLLMRNQPEWHTRWTLSANVVDKDKVTEALVQRLTDEANRPGILDDRRALDAGAGTYSAESRASDLEAIACPTLLIWGEDNPLLTVTSGREAFAKVGAKQKRMKVLPDASHMIPVEKSAESLVLAKNFLKATGYPPSSATENQPPRVQQMR